MVLNFIEFSISYSVGITKTMLNYKWPKSKSIFISAIFEFKYSEIFWFTFFAPQDYKVKQELAVRKKYKIKQLYNSLIACS